MSTNQTNATLRDLLARRILILDGAMGTMIQRHEADRRPVELRVVRQLAQREHAAVTGAIDQHAAAALELRPQPLDQPAKQQTTASYEHDEQ